MKFKQHILKTEECFLNNDVFLGFRKLIDCAMDTQDMAIYQKVIQLTDWKEKNPDKTDELTQRSLSLLKEIAQYPVEEKDTSEVMLKATDIVKNYGLGKFQLGPISLELKKGQVYGLVGENGNGKTTLLRILAKELLCDGGQLEYNFDHQAKNNYQLRTKLIYIPQRTKKWYGSLKNNLEFVLSSYGTPPNEIEPRVLIMIARLGLWNYKHLKWSELSSGYKMRFELARTLLRKPELLLLDEPLANLDIVSQQVILEDLRAIANSVSNPLALILSSQQLYEVEKNSDNIIFLKNGKYTDNNNSINQKSELIIELETKDDRNALQQVLSPLGLQKLHYNGGVFVAHFADTTSFNQVMAAVGQSSLKITYIRDISLSTRRFFH